MLRVFRTVLKKNYQYKYFCTKQEFKDDKKYQQEDINDEDEEEYHFNPYRLLGKVVKWTIILNMGYNFYKINEEQKNNQLDDGFENEQTRYDTYPICKWIYTKASHFQNIFFRPPLDNFLMDELSFLPSKKLLIINFNHTIIQKNIEFGKGVEIIIRPHLMEFLKKQIQSYEIIFFSNEEDSFNLMEMASKLKCMELGIKTFGREFLINNKGKSIKDLDYFNRNLKNIILLDRNKNTAPKHQDNIIVVPDFDQNDFNDKTWKKLNLLLKNLLESNNDLRKEIQILGEDPIETYYQQVLTKYNRKSLLGNFIKPNN